MILPLRDVARPDTEPGRPDRVHEDTFERLRVMASRWGWEPMLSVEGDGYRAWLRRTDPTPRRFFGRRERTAEGATLALIARIEPMAKGNA